MKEVNEGRARYNINDLHILFTQDSGGYRGNGAISFVATLLGSSNLPPNFFSFLLLATRDFDLSINAACIILVFLVPATI